MRTGTRSRISLVATLGLAAALRGVFPVPVRAASPAYTSIATGYRHTCAVTTDGGLQCWGLNNLGQLGDATTVDRHIPVDVNGLSSGISMVDAGGGPMGAGHTCAVTGGQVKCWGQGSAGQLGDGTNADRDTPVDVLSLMDVATISTGGQHTCAVTNTGAAYCWGYNSTLAIGDGTSTNRHSPTPVSGLGSGVTQIAAGLDSSCAVRSGGLKCWGSPFGSSTPVDVAELTSDVVSVSTIGNHWCVRTAAGGVKCFGQDNFGQLGDDGTTSPGFSLTPVDVASLSTGVVDLAAGGSHSCAALADGSVRCWGLNNVGQIGNGGSSAPVTPPDTVVSLTGASVVAAGGDYGGPGQSCAVTTSGDAFCWGLNNVGQLGNGTTTSSASPVPVGPIATEPDPPTGVTAAPGDSSAIVGWSAPASDGGSSITGYEITASPGGAMVTVEPDVLQATVTGLTNCTIEYMFTVKAFNSEGASLSSSPSSSVIPRAITTVQVNDAKSLKRLYNPGVIVVPHDQCIQVDWEFAATNTRSHTVTDLLALGPASAPLYDSGLVPPGGSFSHYFNGATTFTHRSNVKGDSNSPSQNGNILLPVQASPSTGSSSTSFLVRWAPAPIPGYVFNIDYQFQRAGKRQWTNWTRWLSNQSGDSATFLPNQGTGLYRFRARMGNQATQKFAGYSWWELAPPCPCLITVT